jgi:dTDP-4-dehydrorhamnose reductase
LRQAWRGATIEYFITHDINRAAYAIFAIHGNVDKWANSGQLALFHMRILLTGATGQVGHALLPKLHALGEVMAPTRAECDLSDAAALSAWLARHGTDRPFDLIINPAAYTAVDRAEAEPQLAHAINAQAPAVLAQVAKQCDALLVHVSTDYIFGGMRDTPWQEDDTPNPLSVYGRTKLAGEGAVRASGAMHLILRTAWVYGPHGGNFLRTMLRLMRERASLNVVNDQFGAPTLADDLADTIVALVTRWIAQRRAGGEPRWQDTVHATAQGQTSWLGYAQAILAAARAANPAFPAPALHGIATSGYPTPAKRPQYSVLSGDKLMQTYGLALPHWEARVKACVAQLVGEKP